MDKKENITLSPEQFEQLLGAATAPKVQQINPDRFDGTMASTVDTRRAMRAANFNKKLSTSKDMIDVSIPLVYAEHIGRSVTVSVNGNTIKIPVDGQFYRISEAHNHQLQKKLKYVDKSIARNNTPAPAHFGGIGNWGRVQM